MHGTITGNISQTHVQADRHHPPDDPRAMRLADVRRALRDGRFSRADGKRLDWLLGRLRPCRNRTLTASVTQAEMATAWGIGERSVRRFLTRSAATFPWFKWFRHAKSGAFHMDFDGSMLGKKRMAPPLPEMSSVTTLGQADSESPVEKEEPKKADSQVNKEGDLPSMSERMTAWLAELAFPGSPTIDFGLAHGLTVPQVRATGARFARHFTAHPERLSGDIDRQFRYGWLPRDAACKAFAARAAEQAPAPAPTATDYHREIFSETSADLDADAAERRRLRPGVRFFPALRAAMPDERRAAA